jgi:hypothetical protein
MTLAPDATACGVWGMTFELEPLGIGPSGYGRAPKRTQPSQFSASQFSATQLTATQFTANRVWKRVAPTRSERKRIAPTQLAYVHRYSLLKTSAFPHIVF